MNKKWGKNEKVKIPAKALDQLEGIRQEGKWNMLNYSAVLSEAIFKDYWELQYWLEENKNIYPRGIVKGFVPITKEVDQENETTTA